MLCSVYRKHVLAIANCVVIDHYILCYVRNKNGDHLFLQLICWATPFTQHVKVDSFKTLLIHSQYRVREIVTPHIRANCIFSPPYLREQLEGEERATGMYFQYVY